MSADSTVSCVADVHAVLGEGPVWVARESALYWLDIKGQKIFRVGDDGQVTEWATPTRIGSIVPR
ncbi:MAG: SMP-30/gluconolactonase/LRE family protein, partial [Sphingomonas sp.]|nr:SMP-30/gluconolactonase/LRE family protein [Sphingomonas sp.]